MATIEQIERDIAVLEKAVSAIADEMRSAYTSYLAALGPVVRQHLILASYHLCTQGYAKIFLNLPFSQRQQLQQAILKLGKQASNQLLALIKTEQEVRSEEPEENPSSPEGLPKDMVNGTATTIENTISHLAFGEPKHADGSATASDPTGSLLSGDPYMGLSSPTQLPPSLDETINPPLFLISRGDSESPPSKDISHCSNPMELAQWQHHLEEAITNTLKTVSRQTNSLLQQTGILSNKLPAQVLEAAVNSSEAAEAIAGPPNLLNLLIETENSEESESSVTQIVAINLRLSEIEFVDATVRAGRKQIRNLEIQVKSLGQEYYKKQRERAVAEAEAAWRSSWFDD